MVEIKKVANSVINTQYGKFDIYAFMMLDGKTHIVLIHGKGSKPVVRIQSHCLFGTAFKSLDCDCGKQIDDVLRYMASCQYAIMLYLDQEGRGYGLFSKVEILSVMKKGKSLKEAQMALQRGEDLREYSCVGEILRYLGIDKIDLIGGVEKITRLKHLGLNICKVYEIEDLEI